MAAIDRVLPLLLPPAGPHLESVLTEVKAAAAAGSSSLPSGTPVWVKVRNNNNCCVDACLLFSNTAYPMVQESKSATDRVTMMHGRVRPLNMAPCGAGVQSAKHAVGLRVL